MVANIVVKKIYIPGDLTVSLFMVVVGEATSLMGWGAKGDFNTQGPQQRRYHCKYLTNVNIYHMRLVTLLWTEEN